MENTKKKIVILRTDRIGEVLLSTVSVDMVKKIYPDALISFVTSDYSRGLLDARTDLYKVYTADTFSKKGFWSKASKLASVLKKDKYETAYILNPNKMLNLACFLAGIPQRWGYKRKWSFLLTKKIQDRRNEGKKHEIEYLMDFFGLEKADFSPSGPELPLDGRAVDSVEKLIRDKDINLDKGLVAVHPGSSNPAKIWPSSNYAQLARYLKLETGCEVVFLGDKDERELTDNIIAASEIAAHDLAGALDLRELAAFLEKADLFIGNDAGPMHMAAALDVPVIAIFGRNIAGVSPKRWRPWGEKNVIFHESPGCEPCYDDNCPFHYKCLSNITVEMVRETAEKLLKERKHA